MKKVVNSTYLTCHWCHSPEIKLIPVNSLVNLKPEKRPYYDKIWQERGWPTKLYLCWICKQNCELVYQKLNLWQCLGCRRCLVYHLDMNMRQRKIETPTYEQLPTNCFKCGWKKKHLSKKRQRKNSGSNH